MVGQWKSGSQGWEVALWEVVFIPVAETLHGRYPTGHPRVGPTWDADLPPTF